MSKVSNDNRIHIVREFLKENGCEVVDLMKRVNNITTELQTIQLKLDFLRSSLVTEEERLKFSEEMHKIIHGE